MAKTGDAAAITPVAIQPQTAKAAMRQSPTPVEADIRIKR
jgi:hypothetical protein